MHKYVVMAHADGPAELAGEVAKLVLEHHGSVNQLVTLPDPARERTFDFVGVFDLPPDLSSTDFDTLDSAVKGLPAERIETARH